MITIGIYIAATLFVALVLAAFLGTDIRMILSDVRGVAAGMVPAALRDRGSGGACALSPLPTSRYPVYSETRGGVFDANGNLTIEFEAERDYLLIGLAADMGGTSNSNRVFLDLDYCNTKYMIHSVARAWQRCCDRKPIFLVGVRDNKTLRFKLSGGVAGDPASLSVHGFQGNGCCGEGGAGSPISGDGLVNLALAARMCDASDRIPTSAWPFFSQTLEEHIANLGTSASLDFKAERDVLFTDMSISVTETDTPDTEVAASVAIEYCDVIYGRTTDVALFNYCCARKPIFLVGVKENKRLKFVVTLGAAADEDNTVLITLSGVQGNGCCD